MTTNKRHRRILGATLVAVLSTAGLARSSVSAGERCVADKAGAVGKYAACLQKAERTYRLTADADRLASAVAKCESSELAAFAKAELSAGAGNCPVESDAATVASFTSSCLNLVTDALDGTSLPAGVGACFDALDACQASLGACTASLGSHTLMTGQTICTNQSGTTIACAGSGQDGEILAGIAPAYTDNGDGTVTDDVTGLVWEKLSNDGSIHDKDTGLSWLDGLAKVASLNAASFAGHSDWRMPNIRELETLVNFGRDFPTATDAFNTSCTAGCTVLDCNCTNSSSYWSSTTFETDRPCAWSIDFGVGSRAGLPKTNSFRVRAVRGGV